MWLLRPLLLAAPLWLWLGVAALVAGDEAAVTPVFVLALLLPPAAVGAALTARSGRQGSARAKLARAAGALAVGVAVSAITLLLWLQAAEHLCGGRYECPF